MSPMSKKRIYSRSEYISDLVVHVAGIVAVLAAVPAAILIAATFPTSDWNVTAASVYGAGLAAMIVCSALYNIFQHEEWEWLLKRLDHSAIYLKIAGTYTAFVLVAGEGAWIAVSLWATAVAGITLKLVSPYRFRAVSLALYLGMGWLAALAGWELFASFPRPVVILVATGGTLYTIGVAFHLWHRLPHHTTVWHVFVLMASFTIYAGFLVAIIAGRAAQAGL
ncbi:Hly-III family protein [Silicimonas algicola]|nr:Hly-III family protein [Silicimonas algicola]